MMPIRQFKAMWRSKWPHLVRQACSSHCNLDLWDECRHSLRAGAKNVWTAKSMFQITDHSENTYQPSCVHQFCTDVFIFTLCLLKVLLEQLLSTACSLSIKTEHLFQCLKSVATNESAHKFEAFVRTNRSAFHTFLRPIKDSAPPLRGSRQPSHYSKIGGRQCYLGKVGP